MIFIYDLASYLNISLATVSRALKDDSVVSNKTMKNIAGLAEEVGYRSNHFARNLRQQSTKTIGVTAGTAWDNKHHMGKVFLLQKFTF